MTSPQETLIYWIRERWDIKLAREAELPKPWSRDWVFQTTFFCNVRREDDKVTKWIRNYYSPHVEHPMFEYNIILSRFVNWPATLEFIGYQTSHEPMELMDKIFAMNHSGKAWGNAYVITTHGLKMGKAQYLAENVLGGAYRSYSAVREACTGRYLDDAFRTLKQLEGLGSFLAAQVVADLKNTVGHPLNKADDWSGFVAHGPGSLRGASWFHYGEPGKVTPANFEQRFWEIRHYVDERWPLDVPKICNQDLQNCLCEYDKYMRVKNGTGRSKRGYNGSH